ncbi:MAG TPA: hypothetical protein VFJ16_31195 [Longimicrobium sp.]|nr:hypothetical protein [Longimicrobium sp.]
MAIPSIIIECGPRRRRPAPAQREVPPPTPASARLLRPAAVCPRCGARPAMRFTVDAVQAVASLDAGVRIGTYQCQRRGCGAVYDLMAAACQRAG